MPDASVDRSGRNSCSGGSSRRTVTGRSPIASKSSTKTSRCSGSRTSRRSRALVVVARHDHRRDLGLVLGGEQRVLRPAQADALGAHLDRRARVLPHVGVRAHAEPAPLVAPLQDALEGSPISGSTSGTSSSVTTPVVPSMAIWSPSLTVCPPSVSSPAVEVDAHLADPDHARPALAARDQRGVRAVAALEGEDPGRGGHARVVVGPRLGPHEDDVGSAAATASSAVKTTAPLAAPGDAPTPLPSAVTSRSGSNCSCSSGSRSPALKVSSASSTVSSPSSPRRTRSGPTPPAGAWRPASAGRTAAPPRR